jgi:hypothetical protein
MPGFNVGPSQNFQGKVLRQPSLGGAPTYGGGTPMMGSGAMMRTGGINNGAGMGGNMPIRRPMQQPTQQLPPEQGVAVAPSTGIGLPPGAVSNNGMMASQAPMGGMPPISYGGDTMTPPSYVPPNANPNTNPQGGLFNRYAMMRGRM